MFIPFDPQIHKDAFNKGILFELQTAYPKEGKGLAITYWAKVTDKEVSKGAINNPIFFAVEVNANQNKPLGIEAWILSDLGDLTFKEALEEFGSGGTNN